MNLITEILGQIIVLTILAIIFTFIVWKLKKRGANFGEFLNKYGEMIAYAGLIFLVLIIGLSQWWMN